MVSNESIDPLYWVEQSLWLEAGTVDLKESEVVGHNSRMEDDG